MGHIKMKSKIPIAKLMWEFVKTAIAGGLYGDLIYVEKRWDSSCLIFIKCMSQKQERWSESEFQLFLDYDQLKRNSSEGEMDAHYYTKIRRNFLSALVKCNCEGKITDVTKTVKERFNVSKRQHYKCFLYKGRDLPVKAESIPPEVEPPKQFELQLDWANLTLLTLPTDSGQKGFCLIPIFSEDDNSEALNADCPVSSPVQSDDVPSVNVATKIEEPLVTFPSDTENSLPENESGNQSGYSTEKHTFSIEELLVLNEPALVQSVAKYDSANENPLFTLNSTENSEKFSTESTAGIDVCTLPNESDVEMRCGLRDESVSLDVQCPTMAHRSNQADNNENLASVETPIYSDVRKERSPAVMQLVSDGISDDQYSELPQSMEGIDTDGMQNSDMTFGGIELRDLINDLEDPVHQDKNCKMVFDDADLLNNIDLSMYWDNWDPDIWNNLIPPSPSSNNQENLNLNSPNEMLSPSMENADIRNMNQFFPANIN